MTSTLTEDFHQAVMDNDLSSLRRLIKQGVDINEAYAKKKTDSGPTPLARAAIFSRFEAAKVLVEAGADVNKADVPAKEPKPNFNYRRRTPLIYAASEGNAEIVKLLLESGASLDPPAGLEETALVEAIRDCESSGHVKVVELLLDAGMKPTDEAFGRRCLEFAVRKRPAEYCQGLVSLLVRYGADPNAPSSRDSILPLHRALIAKNEKGLRELLDAGADPSLTAPKDTGEAWAGLTPLQFAVKIKARKKLIALLENAMAESGAVKSPTTPTKKTTSEKPPSMLTIPKAWDALEASLATNHRKLFQSLAPGASQLEITELIGLTKIRMTKEVKDFFLRHSGQTGEQGIVWEPDSDEHFLLLSTSQAMREWKVWNDLMEAGDFEGEEVSADSGVRPCWWHAKWLPFASNTAGDFLCFDCGPAKGGKNGQVITLWHESRGRRITYESIRHMLNELISHYEQ
ncbi:MAG: ankyrin repeat domain-containing protein [Candidatus Paceibacterota bacterium]